MKYSVKQYAVALYDSINQTKPKDHDKVIENFINILKRNDDLQYYEQIVTAYEEHDKKQKGQIDVTVTTTSETKLTKKTLDELNKIVGKNAVVETKQDDQIIGGVVIRAGDTMIDGSVKTQLSKLRNLLKRKPKQEQ